VNVRGNVREGQVRAAVDGHLVTRGPWMLDVGGVRARERDRDKDRDRDMCSSGTPPHTHTRAHLAHIVPFTHLRGVPVYPAAHVRCIRDSVLCHFLYAYSL